MRKEIESEDGLTIIQTTPALSDAVIAAAQLCGIMPPYSSERAESLSGFMYPDSPTMGYPVTFEPWDDNAHAIQLLAALGGTVKFDGLVVAVNVGGERAAYCEEEAIVNTPAAKTKAMRMAIREVMTLLVSHNAYKARL